MVNVQAEAMNTTTDIRQRWRPIVGRVHECASKRIPRTRAIPKHRPKIYFPFFFFLHFLFRILSYVWCRVVRLPCRRCHAIVMHGVCDGCLRVPEVCVNVTDYYKYYIRPCINNNFNIHLSISNRRYSPLLSTLCSIFMSLKFYSPNAEYT